MKKIDLIKNMSVEQMATLFMQTKVAAVEATLQALGIFPATISDTTKEKVKAELKQFLEMEVMDDD